MVEKTSYWSHTHFLDDIHLGGGYQPTNNRLYLGDIYRVSFTEDKVGDDGASALICHVLTIFFSMPDILTPMDHVERSCAEKQSNLSYMHGGSGASEIELATVMVNDAKSETVSIMSYNVWNFEPKYEARLRLMVEQIIADNPDVVTMQEVRWSNYQYPLTEQKRGDSVLDFASRLYSHGYKYWTWRPAMVYPESAQLRTIEGLAIFSKLPISDVAAYPIDRYPRYSEDYHQRLLLRAEVQTPHGALNVFTSHFSLFEFARDHGCVQAHYILKNFALRGPIVLTGDLNAQLSESKGLKFLIGKESISGVKGFLADAFDRRQPGKSTWTYTTLQKSPKKRIDFIFYDPLQSEVTDYYVIENKFAADLPQPSDHRPIVARLKLKKSGSKL